MNNYDVDFELQSRVRKYLKYTLKNETNSEGEKNILNKLNKSLRKELLMESLGKLLRGIPFFKNNFTDSSLEKLVFSLKKLQISPEEFLFNVLNILIFFVCFFFFVCVFFLFCFVLVKLIFFNRKMNLMKVQFLFWPKETYKKFD